MIACSIVFYGHQQDPKGMPQPYYNYFVLANTIEAIGAVVVSILPLSPGSPEPATREFVASVASEDEAIGEAQSRLQDVMSATLAVQRSYYPPRESTR
ncbi:MAG TPA: hypothetical protein VF215_04320 [Thermoanaerobaculia bacterium]